MFLNNVHITLQTLHDHADQPDDLLNETQLDAGNMAADEEENNYGAPQTIVTGQPSTSAK